MTIEINKLFLTSVVDSQLASIPDRSYFACAVVCFTSGRELDKAADDSTADLKLHLGDRSTNHFTGFFVPERRIPSQLMKNKLKTKCSVSTFLHLG